jgi:hypothetical protein
MKEQLKVEFTDKMEIRMGSPFNQCKLKTFGFSLPELGDRGFQDLFSWSIDFNYVALVKWNINTNNEPGFNIYVADTKMDEVIFSTDRINGICKSVELTGNQLKCIIFKNTVETECIINIH